MAIILIAVFVIFFTQYGCTEPDYFQSPNHQPIES